MNPINGDAAMGANENWWYVLSDERVGPVPRRNLVDLHVKQVLTLEDLVWTDGMANWLPLGQVKVLSADLLEALRNSTERVPPPVPRKPPPVPQRPIAVNEPQKAVAQKANPPKPEKVLYESHPTMFQSHPIAFVLCCLLIFAWGLGLLVLLIWWMQVLGTTLTLTTHRTTLRNGIFSKDTNEVYHSDVRNVRISQSFTNRIFGVGTISISSAALSSSDLGVQGIPNPEEVRKIIDHYRGRPR